MSELLLPNEHNAIREQFKTFGHVGIVGVYSGKSMAGPDRQLPLLSRERQDVPGEFKSQAHGVRPDSRRPKLLEFLESLRLQVNKLGDDRWPQDGAFLLQQVTMLPGTVGDWHQDREVFTEAVAITTVQGNSRLEIEGGVDYSLTQGIAVILDPQRNLWHRGIASDEGSRVGLVVAR